MVLQGVQACEKVEFRLSRAVSLAGDRSCAASVSKMAEEGEAAELPGTIIPTDNDPVGLVALLKRLKTYTAPGEQAVE